jgi:flagellar biosynthesis protein FlhF
MQVKKYIAPSLKEATQQMKAELGLEAIILGTRVIEGDKRFNMKKVYEITAGVDQPIKSTSEKDSGNKTQSSKSYENELETLSKKIFENPEIPIVSSDRKNKKDNTDFTSDAFERQIKEFSDTLLTHEVQKNIVNKLINHLSTSSSFMDKSSLENFLLSTMASMIQTTSFKVNKRKMHKVALVGPTGVGKTTCIAKLAVISKIIHKLNVGLISIDTYRLGAIDQLRIFSEISDIEMAVAYEPDDLPKLLKKMKNKDLNTAQVDETILVLSSTTSTRTMSDVAEKFKSLNYSSAIFSKVDEAVSYGNIMNFVVNQNVPIMFLTNGQVIPDDIVSVNPSFLANLILTGKLYK